MSQNIRRPDVLTAEALIQMLNELPPETRRLPVVLWQESGEYRYVGHVRLCQPDGSRELKDPVNARGGTGAVIGLF